MMSLKELVNNGIIDSHTAKNIYDIRELYNFYKRFVANKYPYKSEAKHISDLAETLEEVHKGNVNKVCVAMPPRHSKSSLVTLAFPIWLIIQNPNLKILIVNAEASLSENFGIRLRELIKECGVYFNVFLSDVKHSSTHLMFENSDGELYQGSIRLVGSSGSITGQDADYLIIDDPYKGFDDITPTLLTKKIEWFKTMILQRLEPHSKLIILHTRWHSDDLQGYLKEKYPDDYTFIEFSAIKKDGSPLWPQRYTLEYLEKQAQQMGDRLFQALYQQSPLDLTSDFFHVDRLHFETRFDDYPIARCRSWDIASSDDTLGDQRDYTAGVRMVKVPGPQYWIFDFEHGQYGNDVKNVIQKTARLDGPAYNILLEPGTTGGAAKLLYEEYKNALHGFNTRQSEPKGTKADRATPLANAIYDGLVHVCINNNEQRELLISQLKSFPNGKHDDLVDAIAYGYLFLQNKDSRVVKTASKRKRRSLR